MLDVPLLAGLSRKSSIYKTLDISSEEALNGTTVLNTIALMNGADILRVHDVKQAKEAVKLWIALNNVK
jgi:dihydropteroate synthase